MVMVPMCKGRGWEGKKGEGARGDGREKGGEGKRSRESCSKVLKGIYAPVGK